MATIVGSSPIPSPGIDTVPRAVDSDDVNPRSALALGAVLAGATAAALALLPTSWLSSMLEVGEDDAASFLVRRYAVSATAALCVVGAGLARGADPARTGLLAFAVWFAGQGIVAASGLATGAVGGLAWLAVAVDPVIAAWFYAQRSRASTRRGMAR
jgi:hypothetical protein